MVRIKEWRIYGGRIIEIIEPKHQISDLYQMQAMPLNIKVRMTQTRIRGWVEYWGEDNVYISFSGGKDSTVLLDIARKMYPNMKAVYVDTGLEFPEIREFVKTFDNVDIIKPKMNFKQVIEKYGYPFISKETSNVIHSARAWIRKHQPEYEKFLTGEGWKSNASGRLLSYLDSISLECETPGGGCKVQTA